MQEQQEMGIQFLCWEDPMEEEMATHSSILAWNIPWTEESGGLQTLGSQKVIYYWATAQVEHWAHIGTGNRVANF